MAGGRGGVVVSRASVRQVPGGLPNGVSHGALGDRAVVDGGGSSHGGHGDAHAVGSSQRAPVCPVPGIAPGAAGAEARDSYRGIPVFPA
ncbi:hypothetical protein PV735_41470 [Streptomyces turgidiscabies]|uniref:Uncharacterized protein n=1 Tax=Streptomyces turgidiscabies (strain Car8) TaxID=698760 RepID=L7ESG5_STRT8|nr:hypothetical protein [Streptomyces turgidiscabies]ELP61335.1 hypothetical protein STRTUCAR8_06893 [Streptomyces turgidiscabies Car8]MDX3499119.1 hypothetical protein [Streptomyces turgidiscabies]